jgi:hypothetical protein
LTLPNGEIDVMPLPDYQPKSENSLITQ